MRRNHATSVVVLALASLVAALLAASCADSEVLIAREVGIDAAGSTGTSFDVPADGGEASTPEPTLLCIGTECPAPFATCPPREGAQSTTVYKCQNDLMTDNDNCGECGHPCPSFPSLRVISQCVGGKCVPRCTDKTVRDCNQIIEDGCEANVGSDPNNCGDCGVKCADGERCIDGHCGCPPGKVQCGFDCVDIKTDDSNCGACDHVCGTEADAGEPPPNAYYGCGNGECGKIRCIQNNSVHWENCDGQIQPNGCEIDLLKLDPNNCGQCGNKCAPGETCRRFLDGHIACSCQPNEEMCGDPPVCVDISTNLEHCGACNHQCPFAFGLGKPHQFATCTDGICGVICEPGFGDCNGNTADGCETNLMVHGGNCGACGHSCDTAAGQPCVNGACLMVSCESVQK
jgi:hypothetical protein